MGKFQVKDMDGYEPSKPTIREIEKLLDRIKCSRNRLNIWAGQIKNYQALTSCEEKKLKILLAREDKMTKG
jgi:hypothetical protein